MRINLKKLLYFISSWIAMTTRFWGVNVNIYLKYIVMAVWTLYLLLCWLGTPSKGIKKSIIRTHFKLMIAPFMIMAIYALVLWGFKTDIVFGNYTKLFSTCLYLILGWGFVSTGYYLFHREAINIIFWGGCCSYLLGSILYLIASYGLPGIVLYTRSLILGEENRARYVMEVHDLTFAMGLFFLFYLFFDVKEDKNRTKKIIISMLLVFLGLKRIEVLAIGISILAYYLVLRWGRSIRFRGLFFFSLFIVVSNIFIYLVSTDALRELATKYSINFSGRLSYYTFSSNYFDFKPSYMGLGYTYFSRLFLKLYQSGYRIDGYRIAAGIHSDILLLYIENGFLIFTGWVFYSFSMKISILQKRLGNKVAESCLMMTIYMFILYFTDNTFTYPITQMTLMLIPMVLSDSYEYVVERSYALGRRLYE